LKKDYKKTLRICSRIMFGVYIICLAYFLFFAESTGRTFEGRTYHYNLELFKEIRRFIVHRHTLGTKAVLLNLVGNIVAFVPFGFFLPILYPRCRNFLYTVFFSFEVSLAVETIQLVSKVGSFDVDDMLLNTIGGAMGCLTFYWMNRVRRNYETKEKRRV
jgi:glycopeptide antibiotics resistance protein